MEEWVKYKRSYFELGIARHFNLGFSIASIKLNGLHIEINLGIFLFRFWSRGEVLFKFNNYWNG